MTPLQKLPKNVGDLGKLIAAKCFKKLTKVQKIATSGHTGRRLKLLEVIFWVRPSISIELAVLVPGFSGFNQGRGSRDYLTGRP